MYFVYKIVLALAGKTTLLLCNVNCLSILGNDRMMKGIYLIITW